MRYQHPVLLRFNKSQDANDFILIIFSDKIDLFQLWTKNYEKQFKSQKEKAMEEEKEEEGEKKILLSLTSSIQSTQISQMHTLLCRAPNSKL